MVRKIILTALLAAIVMAGAGAYGQEDMVVVDNGVFDDPRRPAARFVHDEHNEKAGLDDCAGCHHVYDDNGQLDPNDSSEGTACADCHELTDRGSQPGLRKAFHQQCKGCHLAEARGPIVCAQCHPRATGS